MAKTDNKKTIYILDSYGLIFRCYFAFISRPLTNSKGENVSALFGFFRNLHWIFQHYKPDYIFAAMDSKTKTFRHEMYPEYKATRNKTPEDLHAQIPWICEILEALGVPVLQCDGYEADDVIATVAKKCTDQGWECRILSGDKDLMQLVNDTTLILKPESGAQTWKLTDANGVAAEWGVPPAKLLDLLSLYGDTADNVPGVHGVGVKTASKLLTDYGDLDGIYAHLEEIKGALHQKLADGHEDAYFSQKLIRLCNEVPCPQIDTALAGNPLEFNFKAAADKLFAYGAPAVAKSYAELGLGGGSIPLGSAEASSPTPSNGGHPRNAPDNVKETLGVPEALEGQNTIPLSLKQNDTSAYRAITELAELEKYISSFLKSSDKKKLIAYDSETTSLDTFGCSILGFSLCYEAGKAVYIPLQQESEDLFGQDEYITKEQAYQQLARIFTDSSVTIIMHNAKFDLKVLYNTGFEHTFGGCKLYDTMVTAWLLNPGRSGYSLEYLGETVLGLKGIEFNDIVKKGQTFADVPLEQAYQYAAEDADFTYQLGLKLREPFEADKTQTLKKLLMMEMQVLPILTKMELTGIHLDSSALNTYNQELTRQIGLVEQNIYKEVGHEFNIASPKQLQTVLFEERHLKTGKKTKTGYSTDTSVLEELAAFDPVPRMILEYRELAKINSTYVETLPKLTDKEGRIHTDFVQTGTATGRLSCRDPNLQNIPVRTEAGRKIRSAFTAPKGKVLISADYAQIELVVLAHLSADKNMCKSFNEGTDVHKATAALIYNVPQEHVTADMRRTAKTINFGVIYGMSSFRLANDLGISRTQAAQFIDNYFTMYADVDRFIKETVAGAEQTGKVTTIFGRSRPIIGINSRNKVEKAAAERIAVNSPVQGSAADIVKKAMINVTTALEEAKSPARLLLQVHDELIFECPDDKATIEATVALIKDKMEHAVELNVPLRVSIEYGKNWGEFH
ncbi:MAG: DNA polymerase I [Treponema sp.]|nr:DNA polymerase I [Treponema sp.]